MPLLDSFIVDHTIMLCNSGILNEKKYAIVG